MIPFAMGGTQYMALTPGGSRIVVRSGDTLRFLDPASQQVVAMIRTQLGELAGHVNFLPGGDVLVAQGIPSRVQIWRAPSWKEIADAEAKEKAEGKKP